MFANVNITQSSLTFAIHATCKNALASTSLLSSTFTLHKWTGATMANCMLLRTTLMFTTAKQSRTQTPTTLQIRVSGESIMLTEGGGRIVPQPRPHE
jgi:cytochrome b561